MPLICFNTYIPTIRTLKQALLVYRFPYSICKNSTYTEMKSKCQTREPSWALDTISLNMTTSFQVLYSSSSLSSPQPAHWPILRVPSGCDHLREKESIATHPPSQEASSLGLDMAVETARPCTSQKRD